MIQPDKEHFWKLRGILTGAVVSVEEKNVSDNMEFWYEDSLLAKKKSKKRKVGMFTRSLITFLLMHHPWSNTNDKKFLSFFQKLARLQPDATSVFHNFHTQV